MLNCKPKAGFFTLTSGLLLKYSGSAALAKPARKDNSVRTRKEYVSPERSGLSLLLSSARCALTLSLSFKGVVVLVHFLCTPTLYRSIFSLVQAHQSCLMWAKPLCAYRVTSDLFRKSGSAHSTWLVTLGCQWNGQHSFLPPLLREY